MPWIFSNWAIAVNNSKHSYHFKGWILKLKFNAVSVRSKKSGPIYLSCNQFPSLLWSLDRVNNGGEVYKLPQGGTAYDTETKQLAELAQYI